jgi:hypothetical protein
MDDDDDDDDDDDTFQLREVNIRELMWYEEDENGKK